MPAWPLQHRPRLDLTIVPQDARLRTQMDAGPPMMRRRFTSAIRTWSFSIGPITGADKQVLEAFYTTTLGEGTTPFTWPDENGTTESFRFQQPPAYRQLVAHHVHALKLWMVDVVLEVLP